MRDKTKDPTMEAYAPVQPDGTQIHRHKRGSVHDKHESGDVSHDGLVQHFHDNEAGGYPEYIAE